MNIEDLKATWSQQKKYDSKPYSKTELLDMVDNEMAGFDKKIKRRDRIEIAAAVAIVGFFSYCLVVINPVLSKIGCAILIFSAIFICYKLVKARRKKTSEEYNHSFARHLKLELEKVNKQKRLLKNVLWWYLLPIYVGILLFTLGVQIGAYFKIAYLLAVALIYFFIWKLNQNKVKKYLNPLTNQLNQALEFTKQKPTN